MYVFFMNKNKNIITMSNLIDEHEKIEDQNMLGDDDGNKFLSHVSRRIKSMSCKLRGMSCKLRGMTCKVAWRKRFSEHLKKNQENNDKPFFELFFK